MISVGTDIVHIKRIAKIRSLKRFFHDSEIRRSDPEHLAGILAVKEAGFKALKIEPKWLDIEVKNKKNGQPYLVFSSELNLKIKNYSCSISHDGNYAIAVVIVHLDK